MKKEIYTGEKIKLSWFCSEMDETTFLPTELNVPKEEYISNVFGRLSLYVAWMCAGFETDTMACNGVIRLDNWEYQGKRTFITQKLTKTLFEQSEIKRKNDKMGDVCFLYKWFAKCNLTN